jgi:tetratricopeptide (TPR) repeat protein
MNFAQRVMDCGDRGHILISKVAADMLAQVSDWKSVLYDLGETEVKHGVRLHVFNVFTTEYGNPETPSRIKVTATPTRDSKEETVLPEDSFQRTTHLVPRYPVMQQRPPGTLPDIWNVPHLRNPNFTGREELLRDLYDSLLSGHPAAVTQAISGLGGVGKTQLAIEYTYRNAENYSLVWWVRAEDPITLVSDYSELGQRIGLRTNRDEDKGLIAAAVRDWLSHNSGWLLVFDNAPDLASCERLIPYGTTGHVIITSRNTNWKRLAQQFQVRTMSRDEAVAFLLKRLGEGQSHGAELLCEQLGDLPLALEQAAAYIDASNITISEYLQVFRKHARELLGAVATTWTLSLDRLKTESPEALDLMNLFAFLAPEEIPRELAKKITASLSTFSPGGDLVLHGPIAALRRYSLVEANRYGLTVHRLVQAASRERLSAAGEEATWVVRAADALHRLRSLAGTARVLPHLLTATAHCERLNVASDLALELLRSTGIYLRERGLLASAREVLEQALRIAEKTLDHDDQEVATVVENLAQVYQKQGDLARASELTNRALKIDMLSFGAFHPRVAAKAGKLGLILWESGDLRGAVQFYMQALEIWEKFYGPEHPKIAVIADELSSIFRESGDFAMALQYAERASNIDYKVYGARHAQVGFDENNIALLHEDLGDLTEARLHVERALSVVQEAYGPKHWATSEVGDNARRIGRTLVMVPPGGRATAHRES